jgi:hypothetical protein
MGHLNVQGGITKLEAKDVAEAVGGALMEDAGVKAQTQRDLNYIFKYENPNNIDPNSKEGQAIKDKYLKDNIYDAASKAGGILRQYQDNRSTNVTYSSKVPDGMFGVGILPDPNPNNMVSTPNEGITTGLLDNINKETQELNSGGFNEDGSFKEVPGAMWTKLQATAKVILAKGITEGTPFDNGTVFGDAEKIMKMSPSNSFDAIVPPYYQKAFGEGMTQKQLYNKFQADRANKAKVLTSDWIVADKDRRGTVDANMKAIVGNLPIYKPGDMNDVNNTANPDEIKAAWDSGGVTFNGYTGAITIGTGKSKLIVPLGTTGKTNESNYTQIRMNAISKVTKTLLDIFIKNSLGYFHTI